MTSLNNFLLTMFLIFTTWLLPHVASSRVLEPLLTNKHEKWMAQFGKSYKDDVEKEKRFQIFKKNVEFIELFNAAGNEPFNLSINHFADLTNEEFKALLNGKKKRINKIGTVNETMSFRYHNVTSVPASMDWRKRGAVTPIKDQGTSCGSCWAFATVASMESFHQIKTGKLVSLSEQELVDCVKGNSIGCRGGYMEDAFDFIAKKGGIASEADYPYKEKDEKCKVKKAKKHVATIKGYEMVPVNNEKELLKAVANQPVSVDIDARSSAFTFYSGGIFTGKCGTNTDHVVTIVGYGVDDGIKYWLVKNSWGTMWGEKGYMRLKRNIGSKKGKCGIATNPAYPVA